MGGGFKGACMIKGPMPDMMSGCGGGFANGVGKGMGKDFGQPFKGAGPPPGGCKGGPPPAPNPAQLAPDLQNNEVTVLGDYTGSIKSYNPSEGFGFIECGDLKSLYFHDTYLHGVQMGDFSVGETVQ